MSNETFEKLITNPDVLYIYEVGLQIYGLFEDVQDRDFIVIVNNDFEFKKKELIDNGYNFFFITIKDWFNSVLNNSIIAWKCACLPKKYIHKEHVKLMLQTNPLLLRKEYDKKEKEVLSNISDLISNGNTITAQKELFTLIEFLVLANQIIENHKIVNFKKLKDIYKKMVNGLDTSYESIKNTFCELSAEEISTFKKSTDSILIASKIKKLEQK